MARKLIRSRDIVFLGDEEKSGESHSSPEIPITPTSVSPPIVHDDHRGAGEDNNDGPAEPVEQASLEPLASPFELELRRSIRER